MTPVRTQQSARSSSQPLGGTGGELRRRLLRYHLPLALASAVAIYLWMTLPLFRSGGQQMQMQMPVSGQAADHQMPMRGAQADHRMPPPGTQADHQPPIQAQADGAAGSTEHGRDQAGNPDGSAPLLQYRGLLARFATATGYVALVLLAVTLLIGPANLLLRRRNPVSSYLRRDVGLWTAGLSVVHVVAGFQVHGPPVDLGERVLRYFFARDGSLLLDDFGLANWTGLAATVIVGGLLAISSDVALRKLKAGPWKWLQRLNYALFAVVVAHAVYYGALLRVTSLPTLLLGLSVVAVFVGQAVGVWLWRRRYARATAQPPAPRLPPDQRGEPVRV